MEVEPRGGTHPREKGASLSVASNSDHIDDPVARQTMELPLPLLACLSLGS
jgi:hypothetical protein